MFKQTYEAYGYRLEFRWEEEEHSAAVAGVIMPDWKRVDTPGEVVFSLRRVEDYINVEQDGRLKCRVDTLDYLRHNLKVHAHIDLATHAPGLVFVHSGAVLTEYGLLALPGRSYAGKSTLVKALVERGAVYFSDEYAVLDEKGRVHPFPRALSERMSGGEIRFTPADELGWTPSQASAPLSFVLVARFEEGATWSPAPLSRGQAVLKMLENTVCAQTAPARALNYISVALEGASCSESVRGDVEEAADQILDWMKASASCV